MCVIGKGVPIYSIDSIDTMWITINHWLGVCKDYTDTSLWQVYTNPSSIHIKTGIYSYLYSQHYHTNMHTCIQTNIYPCIYV